MGRKIPRRIKEDIRRKIKNAKKIIFFLDYDGTLTPIRKKPSLARISKGSKDLLKKLSKNPAYRIFIISGRSLEDVRKLIGVRSIYYVGNHGIELSGPGLKYVNKNARSLVAVIRKSYNALKRGVKFKGVLVENKTYTLSVHYRMLPASKVAAFIKKFGRVAKDLKKNKKIRITVGKKVFEVRPAVKWNKGEIVKWILKKNKKCLPICIGDDITDEDAFRAIGKKGISILVSRKRRKSFARYWLKSPKEVIKLLKSL